jgi:LacI family transcriptional regulator
MAGSKPRRQATQADVARAAQVSQATVSYVLSENTAVAIPQETRSRVLEAARALGYTPNNAARTLRTRRTMTIGGVIPDITNPFYPWFERGIQDVADASGYSLITYNTDGDAGKERRALGSVREGRVDGIVLMSFHLDTDDYRSLIDSGVSVVALSRRKRDLVEIGVDSLAIDNVLAAQAAVEHLIDGGHRRIAMIAGLARTNPREERTQGFLQALTAYGLATDEGLIRGGDYTEAGGYQCALEILRQTPLPTAIFAANDLMAIGALRALREAGIRVPDEIAIVGFDDIPAASMVHPPLTTIAQHPYELGANAARMLLERLRGEVSGRGRHVEMPFELIVRSSSTRASDAEREAGQTPRKGDAMR